MSELRQENRCPVSAQTVAGSRSVFGPASTWFIAALQIKVNMRLLLETLTIILVVGATTLNVGAANEHSIARDPAVIGANPEGSRAPARSRDSDSIPGPATCVNIAGI
jgi:hypothetical protein